MDNHLHAYTTAKAETAGGTLLVLLLQIEQRTAKDRSAGEHRCCGELYRIYPS